MSENGRTGKTAREDVSISIRRLLYTGLTATAVALLVMLVVSALAWTRVPDEMAVHFSQGRADRYASRTFGLLAVPVTAAALSALFCLLVAAEPNRAQLRRSGRAFTAVWLAALAVITVVHVFMVLNAITPTPPVQSVVAVCVGLMFIVAGNYLPKARQNWLVGVRTPGTLNTRRYRQRNPTQARVRVVAVGAGLVIVGLTGGGEALFFVAVVGTAALGLVLAGYSWWVWRADPDRHPAGADAAATDAS